MYADIGPARGADIILGCGDLPFEYLGYLMNALDVPLVFVPGNHDPDLSGYRRQPGRPDAARGAPGPAAVAGRGGQRGRPGGGRGRPADRRPGRLPPLPRRARTSTATGSRPAGPGGWPPEPAARSPAPRQASEPHGLDVLLTHAPPRGVGDGPDPAHQGFPALNVLAGRLQPALLLHGHVDPDPAGQPRPPARPHARPQRHRMAAVRPRPATGRVTDVTGTTVLAPTPVATPAGTTGLLTPDWLPPCPLTPGSPGPTSRTTSSVPGGARCWPGCRSGCAGNRTTSTSSCRSTRSSPRSA